MIELAQVHKKEGVGITALSEKYNLSDSAFDSSIEGLEQTGYVVHRDERLFLQVEPDRISIWGIVESIDKIQEPKLTELTIDNSRLSGYGAFTIKIKNGSVLTGCNFCPAGSNMFAAIVYNVGAINAASTLVVDNSTIQNLVTNTSQEYMIDVRNNTNIAITLQNQTKLHEKTTAQSIKLDYMIKDVAAGSTVTKDVTSVVIGKPGVILVE